MKEMSEEEMMPEYVKELMMFDVRKKCCFCFCLYLNLSIHLNLNMNMNLNEWILCQC